MQIDISSISVRDPRQCARAAKSFVAQLGGKFDAAFFEKGADGRWHLAEICFLSGGSYVEVLNPSFPR